LNELGLTDLLGIELLRMSFVASVTNDVSIAYFLVALLASLALLTIIPLPMWVVH